MTNLALGPGDLAKSLDQGFFLPREALAQLQLYAYQAAALPIDAEDLRESLIGTPSGEEAGSDEGLLPRLTPLAAVFVDMAKHADQWHQEIHPGIVGTAHLVSQYAVKSNRTYQTLLRTIRGLQRDALDSELRTRLQRLADRLAADADRSVVATRVMLNDFNSFMTAVDADEKALDEVTETLMRACETEDSQVESINAKLSKAEADLAEANQRYTTAAIVAATTPTYRIVGGILSFVTLGVAICVTDLAGAVVLAVFTTAALKAKTDMDAAKQKLEELTQEKVTALRLRAILRLAHRFGAEIARSARDIQPALERAAQSWTQLAEDIARLKSAATDDPTRIPMLFREAELEAGRTAWQRLGRAADEFRVHAYVRILPEESESEYTVESDDQQPAANVDAEAPSEEVDNAQR